MKQITPHRLGVIKKNEKLARVDYFQAVRALRAPSRVRTITAREDRLGLALQFRHFWKQALAAVKEANNCEVIKGANVSSNAKQRAITSGRWKA